MATPDRGHRQLARAQQQLITPNTTSIDYSHARHAVGRLLGCRASAGGDLSRICWRIILEQPVFWLFGIGKLAATFDS